MHVSRPQTPGGRTLLLTYAWALGTMYSGESWLSCQWLGRVGPWPVSPLGYPKLARQPLTLNKGPRSGLELDNVTPSHGQEGRSWEARWKTPCPPIHTHTLILPTSWEGNYFELVAAGHTV